MYLLSVNENKIHFFIQWILCFCWQMSTWYQKIKDYYDILHPFYFQVALPPSPLWISILSRLNCFSVRKPCPSFHFYVFFLSLHTQTIWKRFAPNFSPSRFIKKSFTRISWWYLWFLILIAIIYLIFLLNLDLVLFIGSFHSSLTNLICNHINHHLHHDNCKLSTFFLHSSLFNFNFFVFALLLVLIASHSSLFLNSNFYLDLWRSKTMKRLLPQIKKQIHLKITPK